MSESQFKYNKKKLRFEPAGPPWATYGLWTLIVLCGMTGVFRAGDYALTNWIRGGETARIAAENNVIRTHKERLLAELDGMDKEISQLEEKEAKLYQQIYLRDRLDEPERSPSLPAEKIDQGDFQMMLKNSMEKTTLALRAALESNSYFAGLYWPVNQDAAELSTIPSYAPVEGLNASKLACGFGEQINPFNKKTFDHTGLDIIAEPGEVVMASGGGKVVSVQSNDVPGGDGTTITIEHGLGYRSRYSHLAGVKVRSGQRVRKGDPIAIIGISGSSIAPHLHYEVLKNGKPLNPAGMMIGGLDDKTFLDFLKESKLVKKALD